MQTEAGRKKRNRFFGKLYYRFRAAKARWDDVRRADAGAPAFQPSRPLWSLARRLSHAGLSEEALVASHGDAVRELRRVCSQCKSRARCARDLKHERRATPAKYCPNERALRALADQIHPSNPQILPFPAARN
jgi:hypothetical protein